MVDNADASAVGARLPDLIAVAARSGRPITEITGSPVRDRLQPPLPADANLSMREMRRELAIYFELDAFLRDHGYT